MSPKTAVNLKDLQARIQNDVLSGTRVSLEDIRVPKGARAEDRLDVYQNAYRVRLIEILSKNYDATWSFLGDAQFYELAVNYFKTYPSTNANARWVGQKFPMFLENEPSIKDYPVIADLAKIERALEDAFDVPNSNVANFSDLEEAALKNVENLVLNFHPSVTVYTFETNAYDVFKSLRASKAPSGQIMLDNEQQILFWRKDLNCMHLSLEYEEGAILRAAIQNATFTQLCEICAEIDDPDSAALRMAGYLRKWIELQLISGFSFDEDS